MAHFIGEGCYGCLLCTQMCPVWAISGRPFGEHIIRTERCVDCGVCGRICIREAVLDGNGQVVRWMPRSEWPKVVIDREACSGCGLCVDICRKKALTMSGPEYIEAIPTLKPEACLGCGICAAECPSQAIIMEAASI